MEFSEFGAFRGILREFGGFSGIWGTLELGNFVTHGQTKTFL
jgi:hypothetical protein